MYDVVEGDFLWLPHTCITPAAVKINMFWCLNAMVIAAKIDSSNEERHHENHACRLSCTLDNFYQPLLRLYYLQQVS